jgi:hypothetical protein
MPSGKPTKTDRFAKAAKMTAAAERAIQKNIDLKESRRRETNKKTSAMQAGVRHYPTPPMPKQHIAKPGKEVRSTSRRCTMPRTTKGRKS